MPPDLEQELRGRLDQHHLEVFHSTQTETTKRWTYEQEIKRPYFHVTELDEGQLANWQKYLDFEEGEGDYRRTSFLYERCLVTAAHYDDLWQRYARWMYAQEGKGEEVRNIYERASCLYTPIARPEIRFRWALFEESRDRPTVAAAIYEAILLVTPHHLDTIVNLANLQRRQNGVEAAVIIYQQHLSHPDCTPETRGALITEMARSLWQTRNDAAQARGVFEKYKPANVDNAAFWTGYLAFELEQPTDAGSEAAQHQRIRSVYDESRRGALGALSQAYLDYLRRRGGKGAAKEFLALDAEVNGPASVAAVMRRRNMGGEQGGLAQEKAGLVNGHAGQR